MKQKYKHLAVITASTIGLTALASAANHGGEKYTYDGSGNIIEKSINGQVTKMSYDGSNKVISIDSATKGGESISYDAAGRPVSYKDAAGQAIRQLSYGYADKVLKADNAGSEAEFFYNAEGQLVGKTVGGKLTPYTWDGNVLAAEGADAFTNEAHITGGVPAMAGDQSVVISDFIGNTLTLGYTDFNSTAYGEGQEAARFTGKVFVRELESYVFQHRMYSPQTCSWSYADPLGFPNGKNNWHYSGCNPLTNFDPDGREWKDRYIAPSVPSPVVDTFPRPSGSASTNTIQYTEGKKWHPVSWHESVIGSLAANYGQDLNGSIAFNLAVTGSFTIGGGAFSVGGSISMGSSVSIGVNETNMGNNTELKATGLIAVANVYQMKHGWTYFQGWNMHPGNHVWVSNLDMGGKYSNHKTNRIQYQTKEH